VTTAPAEGPELTTEQYADAGKLKTAASATVTAAVVRVDAKVNVNVRWAGAGVEVTVAPKTLSDANVAPSETLASDESERSEAPAGRPDAKLASAASTPGFELLNVNCVIVAFSATSE
jgi:hypothetical protein